MCPKEDSEEPLNGREIKPEELTDPSKSLTNRDTSDDIEVNSGCKTSVEERDYDTIQGSAIATCIALSHTMAQANPTVEHGLIPQKVKIKKLPKDKAKDKVPQMEHKDKKSK